MAKGARAEGRGAMARWLTPEGLAPELTPSKSGEVSLFWKTS